LWPRPIPRFGGVARGTLAYHVKVSTRVSTKKGHHRWRGTIPHGRAR
jgi:hypothetical protein